MEDALPYDQWPVEQEPRQYAAEDVFGRHLMQSLENLLHVTTHRHTEMIQTAPMEEVQALARKAAMDGVYAVMMLLDGVASSSIDDNHYIEYRLTARIMEFDGPIATVEVPLEEDKSVTLSSFRPAKRKCVETIELTAGDGLCYAFHNWKEATP